MSSLTSSSALFRINPTNALIDYVSSIKPYHTKVLDVFVEYIYAESMAVGVSDSMKWNFGLESAVTLLPILSADIANNKLTMSLEPVDFAPKLRIGDTFTIKQSSYYDGSFSFTITGIVYPTNSTVVVTVDSLPSLEGTKLPADRLTDAGISALIVGGFAAFNEPTKQAVEYTCGFGYVWDLSDAGNVSSATITKATGTVSQQVLSINNTQLTLAADAGGYVYAYNTPVVFATTGTFPTGIYQGGLYYVVSSGANSISISETRGGAAIQVGTSYTGVLTVYPQDSNINTFVLSGVASPSYQVSVTNLSANQLSFTQSCTIVGVSPATNQWIVTGQIPTLAVGDYFYVNNNTDSISNKPYIVSLVSYDHGTNRTTITTTTPVSVAATVSGLGYVDIDPLQIPAWPTASAVKVNSTSALPSPVVEADTYYFIPTPKYGVFNLSKVRYPTRYDDIVDLTTLGIGDISIHRTEPFLPGDRVTVSGSAHGNNDGQYVVKTVATEGSSCRVSVYQHVRSSTPVGSLTDGTMALDGSFGDPYCAIASADKLHTAVVFAERLQFDFGDDTDTPQNDDTPQFDVQPFM